MFHAGAQHRPDIVWQTNAFSPSTLLVSFSPDGATLASGGRSTNGSKVVALWRARDGSLLRTLAVAPFQDSFGSIRYSHDGRHLAVAGAGTTEDGEGVGRVFLWRLSDGERLWSASALESIQALSFSTEGEYLGIVAESDRAAALMVLRSQDGALFGGSVTVQHFAGTRYSLAYSPQESVFASTHHDGNVRLWSCTNGLWESNLVGTIPLGFVPQWLSYLPDGKHMACADGSRLVVVRLADKAQVLRLTQPSALVNPALTGAALPN